MLLEEEGVKELEVTGDYQSKVRPSSLFHLGLGFKFIPFLSLIKPLQRIWCEALCLI